MNAPESVGLWVSLVSFGIAGLFAVYDYARYLLGLTTISESIWDDLNRWRHGQGPFPIRAVGIVVGLAMIPLGMCVHLFF